jgi:hypothetical protein
VVVVVVIIIVDVVDGLDVILVELTDGVQHFFSASQQRAQSISCWLNALAYSSF